MPGTSLRQIELINFRSYRRLKWHCRPELNIIQGANAAGKTNLLEAIGYLGCARSLRQQQETQLLNWGSSFFQIKGVYEDKSAPVEIDIIYHQNHKKLIINGQHHRLIELLGLVPVIYFGPDDLNILKGGPAYRRQFLDREISIIDRLYCQGLQQYRRILLQRNRLLRALKAGRGSRPELEPWNIQLVTTGTAIRERRQSFLKVLEPETATIYDRLDGRQRLSFIYRPGAASSEEWLAKIGANQEREIQAGLSLWGPHRDDFSLSIDGHEARFFASQGQQRSAVLALKIAETKIFKRVLGKLPLLLLDDVFSELDNQRQQALITLLNGAGQAFITATDLTSLPAGLLAGAAIWHLSRENGLQAGEGS